MMTVGEDVRVEAEVLLIAAVSDTTTPPSALAIDSDIYKQF